VPYYSSTGRQNVAARRALTDAASVPFWQDDPAAPEPAPPLRGSLEPTCW
jgi:hypothetical protein